MAIEDSAEALVRGTGVTAHSLCETVKSAASLDPIETVANAADTGLNAVGTVVDTFFSIFD